MAREIKYTTDGKKVVVIGNLNSTDKIVQEIFIIDGSEIPSGEHFVVKSLHDAPAVSWKEKDLKEWEERYNTQKKLYENQFYDLKKKMEQEYSLFRGKVSYLRKAIDQIGVKSFDMVVDFLSGEIKYLVSARYTPEILTWSEFRCEYSEDKIKLLTLFGDDDGTLTWGLNRYSDGSGGNSFYHAFTNKEDAIKKLTELLLAKKEVNEYDLKAARQYNIELDTEKVASFKQKKVAELQKNIISYNDTISKSTSEITRIEQL